MKKYYLYGFRLLVLTFVIVTFFLLFSCRGPQGKLPIFVKFSGCVPECAVDKFVEYYDGQNLVYDDSSKSWSFSMMPSSFRDREMLFSDPEWRRGIIPPQVAYFPNERSLIFYHFCLQEDSEAQYRFCYNLRLGQCPNGLIYPSPPFDPPECAELIFPDPCTTPDASVNMPWDYLAYAVCFYSSWAGGADVVHAGDECRSSYLGKPTKPTVLPK